MLNFLFGAILLYSAYVHYPHFKEPRRCGAQQIRMMALIIMLATGGYGSYLIYGAFT